MAAIMLDSLVRVPEDVIFRELDGEAVLLNLHTGIYFGLDAVGTRIWQLVELQHGSIRAVWQAMVDEFDAQPERLEQDLLAFVRELNGSGLLTAH